MCRAAVALIRGSTVVRVMSLGGGKTLANARIKLAGSRRGQRHGDLEATPSGSIERLVGSVKPNA